MSISEMVQKEVKRALSLLEEAENILNSTLNVLEGSEDEFSEKLYEGLNYFSDKITWLRHDLKAFIRRML